MDVVKDSLELIKLSLKSSKSFAKFASGLLGNQEVGIEKIKFVSANSEMLRMETMPLRRNCLL